MSGKAQVILLASILALSFSQAARGETSPGRDSVTRRIQELKHEDRAVRLASAKAIGAMGPAAARASAALVALLEDDDEEVYAAAVAALRSIGSPALRAAAAGLAHAKASVRKGAGWTIWGIVEKLPVITDIRPGSPRRPEPPPRLEVLPAGTPLAKALRDSDPYVRRISALALCKIYAHLYWYWYDFRKAGQDGFAIEVKRSDGDEPPSQALLDAIKTLAGNPPPGSRLTYWGTGRVRLEGRGQDDFVRVLDAVLEAIAPVETSEPMSVDVSVDWTEGVYTGGPAGSVRSTLRAYRPNWTRRLPRSDAVAVRQGIEEGVSILAESLSDDGLRMSALHVLAPLTERAAPALPAILKVVEKGNLEARKLAAWVVRWIGPAGTPEAGPVLVKVFMDTDEDALLRACVMSALARLLSKSSEALEAYRLGLKNEQENVRTDSAYCLLQMGTDAAEAVPELFDALGDESWNVRRFAKQAFTILSEKALAYLLNILEQGTGAPRERRLRAILWTGKSGPAAKAAEPHLVSCLRDADLAVCEAAAKALVAIRSGAVDDLAIGLLKDLDSDDPKARKAAEAALGPMASRIVAALAEFLLDERSAVRAVVARVLSKAGPAGQAAFPALSEALEDPEWEVRAGAATAVGEVTARNAPGDFVYDGRVYPRHRPAFLALDRALDDEVAEVREAAGKAMARIGHEADGTLSSMQGDARPGVRRAAVRAQGEIASRRPWTSDSPVEFVLRGLKDVDGGVRAAAAWALGKMGTKARAAVPALERALTDEDPEVQKAAEGALEKVGG
ncbi:MAG: HEAT repeat domain-containing protein [Planctomycetota bacterium]|jgi:HEAT repeat protein